MREKQHTVLDGVLEGEDTTLGLRLVTYVRVLLVHAHHDTGVLGAADNGLKYGAGGIVAGETSLAHTRAVVNNERLDLFRNVSHT